MKKSELKKIIEEVILSEQSPKDRQGLFYLDREEISTIFKEALKKGGMKVPAGWEESQAVWTMMVGKSNAISSYEVAKKVVTELNKIKGCRETTAPGSSAFLFGLKGKRTKAEIYIRFWVDSSGTYATFNDE